MDTLTGLCVLGVLFVMGLFLLPLLLRRGLSGPGASQRGADWIEPTYDDPNIESRGAFGRPAGGIRRLYDSPRIRSRGFFGRSRGASPSRQSVAPPTRSAPSSGRVNSENIRSRGSFGRSKRND